jgi:hypothetical protein
MTGVFLNVKWPLREVHKKLYRREFMPTPARRRQLSWEPLLARRKLFCRRQLSFKKLASNLSVISTPAPAFRKIDVFEVHRENYF